MIDQVVTKRVGYRELFSNQISPSHPDLVRLW